MDISATFLNMNYMKISPLGYQSEILNLML